MVTDEVERKFLVETPPAEDVLGDGVELRQGYLAEEGDVEVRLRITSESAVLTVKAGSGLRRTEVEATISPAEAEALWPSTEGRRIAKTRHRVLLDGPGPASSGASGTSGSPAIVAEVDVYADTLTGLHTVEVEFESEAAAAAFVPPDWFSRELTGDKAWSNAALARHGRPPT